MSRYKILLGEVLKPSKKINIGSGVVLTQNIPSDKNLGIDLVEEFYGHPISQKTCIEIKNYTISHLNYLENLGMISGIEYDKIGFNIEDRCIISNSYTTDLLEKINTKKILELTSTPKNLKDFFYERFKVL